MNRIIIAIAVLMLAVAIQAQTTPSAEDLDKRVRELEKKLDEMAKSKAAPDVEELRQEIEVLTREIETLKLHQEKAAVTADSPQHGMGAAASKVYRSDPGVSIGGYGEMVYENYDSRDDSGAESGKTDQIDLLRGVLYTGYKFNDKVVFNSELEIEHGTTDDGIGEAALEFAYLDFLIRPSFNVRAGNVLIPVGLLNEIHEPTTFLGSRRPSVEQQILPTTWHENGVGIFGDVGSVTYRAFIVNGLNSEGFSASGIRGGRQDGAKAKAEDFAVVGRADWKPVEGLLLGGSLYSGSSSQGATTPSGTSFNGNVTISELHADAHVSGFMVRGLWAHTSVGDVRQINEANGFSGIDSIGETQQGWYGEVGYDVTTLFPMRQSSLVPFVRYEQYDTQRSVPSGFARNPKNDVDVTTIGINWKPIPQAVIKVDYQNIDDAAGTGVDQVNAALGYIF